MIPVCIFAKAPEPGNVKTRLTSAVGSECAALLASAMFQDVWNVVSACPQARPILATLTGGSFPVTVDSENIWLQGDGDLGMRLESILRRGLQQASAAIAIGADSPSLTACHLESAIKALENHDAVIGRSLDGGFYLLGVRQCAEGLLDQLPWSTCDTAQATVLRLKQQGFVVHELLPLFDVDTPDDLLYLVNYLRAHVDIAPVTRAWCVAHGFLNGAKQH